MLYYTEIGPMGVGGEMQPFVRPSEICIPLGISPLFGPVESNEPIAIEVRERGEYSAESLRDDECEDGELSCFIDEYDWVEEV